MSEHEEPEPSRADKPRSQKKQAKMVEQTRYCLHLMAKRLHKHEIFSLMRFRFKCSTPTCQRIMARAREELIARTGKSKQEHRVDAYALYEDIIRDPASGTAERMHAQAAIRQLLGLDAPLEHRHGQSGEAGAVQVVTQTIVSTRQEARELLAMLGDQVVT